MPIGIDRFEEADALDELSTSERIIRFLLANDEQAYTRQEIADAIDSTPETVGTNLTRLKDRGLVRHRAPYWALTADREQARRYLSGGDVRAEDDGRTKRAEESPDATSTSPQKTPHGDAVRAFIERVQETLNDEVDSVHLFGSVAREEATAGSDVDVLVVISDEASFAAVDDELLDIAYDIQLEYGVPVEVHSIRASEFTARKERGDPFIETVLTAGATDE